jgi:hypothetical protein
MSGFKLVFLLFVTSHILTACVITPKHHESLTPVVINHQPTESELLIATT